MEALAFSAEIPVKYQADVVVAGAGPGGIAAAVVAARQGARVLLFDAHTFPGGLATAGRVPVLMNCSDGVDFLPGGFGREVVDAMVRDAGERGFDGEGRVLRAEGLKLIFETLLGDAGVAVRYACRLAAVRAEGGTIRHAVFAGPSGLFAAAGRVFVDGTGDGVLSLLAGAPCRKALDEGDVMPATLCSLWAGVDWRAYRAGGAFSHNDDKMLDLLEAAFRDGSLSVEDYHHTGFSRQSNVAVGANIGHVFDVDADDEASLTEALMASRRLLREYEAFYRARVAGFSGAEIVDSGSLLGVRETRRVVADYELTRDDYLAKRTFPDEIGRYNFPADVHPSRPGRAELEAHKKLFHGSALGKGESYGIPYRILLPKTMDNLLACGRCVGTDRFVHASLRVIPGCFITGQAAGMAAAMAAERSLPPRALDAGDLRARLRAVGAFFR